MTREVQIVIKDDLTDEEGARTIAFGVDNTWYEIDLTRDNEEAFRNLLKLYLDAARKADNPRSVRTAARVRPNQYYEPGHWSSLKDRAAQLRRIRAWAAENGHRVAARGRIARRVVEAYNNDPKNAHDQVEPEPIGKPLA